MKKLILTVMIVCFTAVLSAPDSALAVSRSVTVYEVTDAPIYTSTGQAPNIVDIRRAIITAVQKRKWQIRPVDDNNLEAWILVRGRHFAKVDINYTPQSFSITYKESRELGYDKYGKLIHPNYNKWIKLLERDINTALNLL